MISNINQVNNSNINFASGRKFTKRVRTQSYISSREFQPGLHKKNNNWLKALIVTLKRTWAEMK